MKNSDRPDFIIPQVNINLKNLCTTPSKERRISVDSLDSSSNNLVVHTEIFSAGTPLAVKDYLTEQKVKNNQLSELKLPSI